MPASSEEKNPPLRRIITGAIVIASFLPMLVVLWVVNIHFNASFDNLTRQNLQSIANRHSVRIDTFVHERLNSLRLLAAAKGRDLLNPVQFKAALRQIQDIYGDSIVDMGLVDQQGRQQVYAGPLGLDSANYAASPWFREMQTRNDDIYISDVFLGLRKSPHFIVALRLNMDGKPLVLRATVDFAQFSRVVGELRVGNGGKVCIINQQGEYQTPPLSEPEESPSRWAARARPLFGAPAGQAVGEYIIEDGVFLYTMSPLKSSHWVLILRIDRNEAFAGMAEADRALYLSLALISLAVLVGGVFLSWRIMDHMEKLERERAALNDHLIQTGKLSALGEMAAGIAHEINNPVAIMLEEAGWIEDVLDDMPKDSNTAEIAQSLGKIRSQGTRCRSITHKLLGFARKSDEPDQAVHVANLLREMAALTDQKARNADVSISLNLEADLPPVRATTSVVQQIILNLLNNAVDAMEGMGGEVLMTAKFQQDTDMVLIRVADSGPGIPPQVKLRIFDPFFTTKAAGKGTGLGLSICYGIVRGLGGSITVDSQPGQGSVFDVRLPVQRNEN